MKRRKRKAKKHLDWLTLMGLYESLEIIATDRKGKIFVFDRTWFKLSYSFLDRLSL